MKATDIISMGSRNLFRRKTRTILTIIGVLVGATAIILMVSIGIGMNASLDASIARMGDLTLIELQQRTWRPSGEDVNSEWQEYQNELNDEVLNKIKEIDGVIAVTPVVEIYNYFKIRVNGKYELNWAQVQGIDPAFLPYMGIEAAKGQMPGSNDKSFILFGSDTEYEFLRIGKTIYNWNKEFYYSDGTRKPPKVDMNTAASVYVQGYSDPSGYWDQTKQQWVENTSVRKPKFTKFYFDKVGVMKQSDTVYQTRWVTFMDLNTVIDLQREIEKSQRTKNSTLDTYPMIKIKTADLASAEAVQKVLSEELHLTMSFNLSDQRKEMQKQQATLQMMLGIIGAVSLLVAAIGITNTMYMSIYERTKEIGVMKVLGCPLGGIQSMFLFEAGMIGFFGGLAGIGFSMLASYVMNNLPVIYNALSKMNSASSMYYYMAEATEKVPVSIIPTWLIGLTIVFATLIGLFAGYLPARRATKISALEAIRNE